MKRPVQPSGAPSASLVAFHKRKRLELLDAEWEQEAAAWAAEETNNADEAWAAWAAAWAAEEAKVTESEAPAADAATTETAGKGAVVDAPAEEANNADEAEDGTHGVWAEANDLTAYDIMIQVTANGGMDINDIHQLQEWIQAYLTERYQ